MKGLTINFPPEMLDELGRRAKKNHRSIGAEIRFLTDTALAAEKSGQARELAESLEEAKR